MTDEEQVELLRLLADVWAGQHTYNLTDEEKDVVRILVDMGYVSIDSGGKIKRIK